MRTCFRLYSTLRVTTDTMNAFYTKRLVEFISSIYWLFLCFIFANELFMTDKGCSSTVMYLKEIGYTQATSDICDVYVTISTHNMYDDHTQMMSNVHGCRVRCGG